MPLGVASWSWLFKWFWFFAELNSSLNFLNTTFLYFGKVSLALVGKSEIKYESLSRPKHDEIQSDVCCLFWSTDTKPFYKIRKMVTHGTAPPGNNTRLWLVNTDHVTWMRDSDWSISRTSSWPPPGQQWSSPSTLRWSYSLGSSPCSPVPSPLLPSLPFWTTQWR